MTGRPRLELVALRKSFGSTVAVAGVDLAVEEGELFTLLGPSGSGKTTILRMVAGFEAPSEGGVRIDGREVGSLSPAERDVGVVFQHYALFPHMTVAQNVEYPLRMRRVTKRERRARVARMLELVRLTGLEERRSAQLSGGQQQRVALARALVFSPRVLLMDEPLGALDRTLRVEMQEELRRIHRETGTTIVYVTHDQEEALALSDRIGVLRAGSLLQHGAPRELFEAPRDAFVARFFGDCNVLPVTRASGNGSVRWGLGNGRPLYSWTSPADGATGAGEWRLAIRPGRVSVEGRADGSAGVVVPAIVEEVVYLGERTRVRCTTAELGTLVAETDGPRAAELRPGSEVSLAFDPREGALVRGEE